MQLESVCSIYFSATYTTRRIVRTIAGNTGFPLEGEYDITMPVTKDVDFGQDRLAVVGVPVYAGRVPAVAVQNLARLHGHDTPAIAVAVYGNRDYDDALLELTDILEGAGFRVMAAAAMIAQHSIFPAVGHDRPDESDGKLMRQLAVQAVERLASVEDMASVGRLGVPGNFPYKVPGKIPLRPVANRKCDGCGTCVRLCPSGAIPSGDPRTTDAEKCISCGRCIVVCPRHARHFGGMLYRMAAMKFVKANSTRKEPELFI